MSGDQRLSQHAHRPEKRRLNHPNPVINCWRALEKKTAAPPEDKPLSAFAMEMKANIAAPAEEERDGNSFTKDSTVKEIATAVIGTFDGLPSKVSRVQSIAGQKGRGRS